MTKNFTSIIIFLMLCNVSSPAFSQQKISIKSSELKNKIKVGWAGKTIGVTFGGPVEPAHRHPPRKF